MKAYAQDALNYYMTYAAGISSIQDIVNWADSIILKLGANDADVVKLSLASKCLPQETLLNLHSISDGSDINVAIRHLLCRIHRHLLTDKSDAKSLFLFLAQLRLEFYPDISSDLMYYLYQEDDYILAEQGVRGDTDELIDRFIKDIAIFDSEKNDAT
jgi:hypothetical protein